MGHKRVCLPYFYPWYKLTLPLLVPGLGAASDEESASEKDNEKVEPREPAPIAHTSPLSEQVEKADPHPIIGAWAEPRNLYIIFR
jgi:hypothetical protein